MPKQLNIAPFAMPLNASPAPPPRQHFRDRGRVPTYRESDHFRGFLSEQGRRDGPTLDPGIESPITPVYIVVVL